MATSAPKQTSTKTYGVGPAVESSNVGTITSENGEVSVLNADGTVTDPKGKEVFDPAKDLVEVKTDDKEFLEVTVPDEDAK